MNSIFISYSKEEPEPTLSLAKSLEDLGYSVWWDVTLKPGDDFAEVIQTKLRSCAAAIIIWSASAAKSRWVRAEAQIADRYGKLIPVRVDGFDLNEIPPPYNILHTDLASNVSMIVSKLTEMGIAAESLPPQSPTMFKQVRPKPEVANLALSTGVNNADIKRKASTSRGRGIPVDPHPGDITVDTGQFRFRLIWTQDRVKIAVLKNITGYAVAVALAITSFSLSSVVGGVAKSARFLVEHWQIVVTRLWDISFGWTGLAAPPFIVRSATVSLAIVVLALIAWRDQRKVGRVPAYLLWIPESWSERTREIIRGLLMAVPYVIIVVLLNAAFDAPYWEIKSQSNLLLAAYRLVIDPLSQFGPVVIAALFVRIEYLSARAWQAAIIIVTILTMSWLSSVSTLFI